MHIEDTPERKPQMIETVITGDSDEKEALLQDLKENLTETMNLVAKLSEDILGFVKKEKDIESEITDGNKFQREIRKGIQRIDDSTSK